MGLQEYQLLLVDFSIISFPPFSIFPSFSSSLPLLLSCRFSCSRNAELGLIYLYKYLQWACVS